MVQSEIHTDVEKSDTVGRFIFPLMSLLVLACWAIICFISREPTAKALIYFLLLSAIMVLAAVTVVWRYYIAGQRIPFLWILLSAVLLRLIALYGEPLFEDDHFRYMWDGYQTVETQNPYTDAPAEFFDRDVPENFEPILSLINYPEVATVYGPVAQWIFALGYLTDAAKIWPLQLFAGLADVLILLLLFRLGAGNALLFYAWSPLLLKEFALTAHPDVYAILGVMASIVFLKRQHVLLAGVALGLGFGAKVFAVLALPYLLSSYWVVRHWLKLILAFLVTLLGITLWFGTLQIWVPEGLLAMADSWLFNAGLYLVLLNYFDARTIKVLLLSIFVLYVMYTCIRRLQRRFSDRHLYTVTGPSTSAGWSATVYGFRGDWLFVVFLLALPVINPWYVTWILPFATLYPRCWSWALSYCCLISYWYGVNIGDNGADSLQLTSGVIALEYAAVILISLLVLVLTNYVSAPKVNADIARA